MGIILEIEVIVDLLRARAGRLADGGGLEESGRRALEEIIGVEVVLEVVRAGVAPEVGRRGEHFGRPENWQISNRRDDLKFPFNTRFFKCLKILLYQSHDNEDDNSRQLD